MILNSKIVRGNKFGNFRYTTFDHLWKKWEKLAFLDRLAKIKNELNDKINQLLASENLVQNNNKLSDKNAPLQMGINNHALEENLFSSSSRAQVAEN